MAAKRNDALPPPVLNDRYAVGSVIGRGGAATVYAATDLLLDDRPDHRIRAKLADFGISTIIGTHEGESTTGTAAYLAPEIAEGGDAEPASDVYSLGLVLLEAATARVAFPGTIVQS